MLRFSKPEVQEALLIKLLCQTISLKIMILAERERLALDITLRKCFKVARLDFFRRIPPKFEP